MNVGTDAEEWVDRARAHLLADEFDLASAIADSVLAVDPHDPDALCVRATCLLADGKYAEALAVGEAIKAVHPSHAWSRRVSAQAHAYLGHHDEAFEDADQAVRLGPGDKRNLLTRIHVHLVMHHVDGTTVTAAREAVRLHPESAECQQWLAKVLFVRGRMRAAARAARAGLELDPEHAGARAELDRVAEWRRQADTNRTGLEPADHERWYELFHLLPTALRATLSTLWAITVLAGFTIVSWHRWPAPVHLLAGAAGVATGLALVVRLVVAGGTRTPVLVRELARDDGQLRGWLACSALGVTLLVVSSLAPPRVGGVAIVLAYVALSLAEHCERGLRRHRRKTIPQPA